MLNDQGLLAAIFCDPRPSDWLELCLVEQDQGSGRQVFFRDPLKLLEAAEAQGDKVHCLFGVAPREDRSGVGKSVTRVGVIWADLDAKEFSGGKDAAYAAADLLVLPPSYVTDSGHGYHAYWLLNAYCKAASVRRVCKLVGDLIGGGNVSDPIRRMRIPGTFNVKPPDGPLLCSIVRARPDLRYSLKDIERATKISAETRRSILTGTPGARAKDKTRSGVDWQVGSELVALQMSEEAMRAIWSEHPIGGKYQEEGESYLQHTLDALQQQRKRRRGGPATYYDEDGEAYYVDGLSRRGRHIVSTFTFQPRRLLEGPTEDVFYGDIRSGGHVWEGITLSKKAFTRVDSLMRELGRAGWQWLGNDLEVRFLLPYLVRKWKDIGSPKATATPVLGRHEDYWVAPEYTLSASGVLDPYTAPIVYANPHRVAPAVAYPNPEDLDPELWQRIHQDLRNINLPDVVWPILGWFMATPYKPVLRQRHVMFPHLALYGTTGAGKSATLEAVFMPLMGYRRPAHSEDCSTTPFVLLSWLASANAIPVSLAEFRRTTLGDRAWRVLLRTLLLAYDTGHDSRGKPSQETVDYPLHAPLVLSGEDVVTDPAVRRRTVVVGMSPDVIEPDSPAWEAFMRLTTLPLEHFASPYIQHTLALDEEAVHTRWQAAFREILQLTPDLPEERVRRNFATTLFGIRSYEEFMRSQGVEVEPAPARALLPGLREVHSTLLGRGYVLVDDLVVDLINEVAQASNRFVYSWDPTERVLWIHLTTALQWWQRDRLSRREPILDSAAVKRQFRELSQERPGRGHYIRGPKSRSVEGSSRRMYGIDVQVCWEAGLDIPETLTLQQRTITFKQGGNHD